MHIVCKRELLINAIKTVSRIVNKRTKFPILECILLVADEDGFRLIGNNLELSIETANIETEIYQKGEIAIEAKLFSNIIKNMSGTFVTIKADERNLCTITSEKSEFEIQGMKAEEFPKPVITKGDNETVGVVADELKYAIKHTIFSVAVEETRPIFTGELFKFDEGFLNIVAIDGYRISWRKIKVDSNVSAEMVIPAKVLKEIIKFLPSDDSIVYIHRTSREVVFEINDYTIVSKLLSGDFLRYESLFDGETTTTVTVATNDLLRALEKIMVIAPSNGKVGACISITEDIMNISAKTDLGTSKNNVEIELDGQELDIVLNTKYVIDVLKNVDEEYVNMNFHTNKSPCIITSTTNEDYKYMVLPIDPSLAGD